MTNTKEKTIHLHYSHGLLELHSELAKRGETIKSISFVDEKMFKFEKGTLFLFGSLSKIKNFVVVIEDEEKSTDREYIPIGDCPIDLEDFKVSYETTHYK